MDLCVMVQGRGGVEGRGRGRGGEQPREEAKPNWGASKECWRKQKRWMGSHTIGHSDREDLRLS